MSFHSVLIWPCGLWSILYAPFCLFDDGEGVRKTTLLQMKFNIISEDTMQSLENDAQHVRLIDDAIQKIWKQNVRSLGKRDTRFHAWNRSYITEVR